MTTATCTDICIYTTKENVQKKIAFAAVNCKLEHAGVVMLVSASGDKNMEYGEDGGGRAMRNDEVMTGEVCTVAR